VRARSAIEQLDARLSHGAARWDGLTRVIDDGRIEIESSTAIWRASSTN
jgi:hypothetical protein